MLAVLFFFLMFGSRQATPEGTKNQRDRNNSTDGDDNNDNQDDSNDGDNDSNDVYWSAINRQAEQLSTCFSGRPDLFN